MKPFNLEHAKAGAPVALEDGTEATIIKFDGRNEACPLVVLVGDRDRPHLASTEGYVYPDTKQLVMRPVGTLEGREVYHGDRLDHRSPGSGSIVQLKINAGQPYMDFTDGVFNALYWSCPAAYPVTRMTDEELDQAAHNHHGHLGQVANAAIRHGIDNGYLLDAEGRTDVKGILGRVARAVGITTRRFEFTEIESALRAREVAIGKHFYNLGTVGACDMWPTLSNLWFEDNMPKVKP